MRSEKLRLDAELRDERLQASVIVAREVDAMTRLAKLGTLSVSAGDLAPVLKQVVDAAIAIAAADFGNIALLDADSGALSIVAQGGLPPWITDEDPARARHAFGTSPDTRERIIIEDVTGGPAGAGDTEALIKAGVRAFQSTPLIDRSGRVIGVLAIRRAAPDRRRT
ncbi:MAG: GAF domain-containing protein [Cyanobacteria bacterium]|nr:GAF domain-containing protein [Cyanobacteriota bacterium]